MCGIYGTFSHKGIDAQSGRQATDCLSHRGPDAGAYYTSPSGTVFLGHRRLSIIDLSTGANQPMYSASGKMVIVYNGEVYNFKELRRKLSGFSWQTNGDTEVILELFEAFGPESFSWLNGIFSFSIYDTESGRMWLCRDPLGIKPLFIRKENGRFAFASELKAIVTGTGGSAINKAAIPYFLHLGYIPEPLSIYEGIEKFPAAHYGILDTHSGSWELCSYWSAADYYLQDPIRDESKALQLYQEKLFAAVERQMISDVPLGTFLSGGIDSSLVTAVASAIQPGKVNTFSIGFEDQAFDESVYAGQVAAQLNTQHHLFRVQLDDILALIPEFLDVYDEPFADSSAFPTMLVSRLARQKVTVTLSGDGGDEFFQGYGMYTWAERLKRPAVQLLHPAIYQASRLMSERYRRAGLVFGFTNPRHIPSHIFSQEQYLFSEKELSAMLIHNPFDFDPLNRVPSKGSAREQQAFWDIGHYLKDDLLVKVDRASMYYSLETRVPLLDKELTEFALNLPLEFKIREGYGSKYLMKRALYELVPRHIFERPKRGFSIPLNKWLANELRPMLDTWLDRQTVEEAGFVSWPYADRLKKAYFGGRTYLYNRVWVLLILHWWYKRNAK